MDLSIIIVSYNVRYFLYQCLTALYRSQCRLSWEIIVVDNASHDGSVEMVREHFPTAKLIVNDANVGFARAVNQAIELAKGKYILLLNPDTIVAEDVLQQCFDFMETHPEAGGMGVKMIDGSGKYAPESKRAFPTPRVAFFKLFGLHRLFPTSAYFNRYYLGHLPKDSVQKVEVLSGAFMWLRRKVLDEVGGLDTRFFMYGEDIDLSHRITRAGYDLYYYPHCAVVHFKGESTFTYDWKYVRQFYRAMAQFVSKHYKGRKAWTYLVLLRAGLWLRAAIELMRKYFYRWLLPLTDAVLILLGLVLFKEFWEEYYYRNPHQLEHLQTYLHMVLYTAVWLAGIYLGGGYQRSFRFHRVIAGLVAMSLIQLGIYGLLSPQYRPSRMMLVMGTVWAFGVVLLTRWVWHYLLYGDWRWGQPVDTPSILVGRCATRRSIERIYTQSRRTLDVVGVLAPDRQLQECHIAPFHHLRLLCIALDVKAILWDTDALSFKTIIRAMECEVPGYQHQFWYERLGLIVASPHRNRRGGCFSGEPTFPLSDRDLRRLKRLLDWLVWGMVLVALPLLALLRFRRVPHYVRALLRIPMGYTWIGYVDRGSEEALPPLRRGIYPPCAVVPDDDRLQRLINYRYAETYSLAVDLKWISYHLLRND